MERASTIVAFAIAIFLLAVMALPAVAGTSERIVDAFHLWMEEFDVRSASIVVFENGRPVQQVGVGADASAPVELASLSKAVTGACVVSQVRVGGLAYSDTLATHLDWSGALGKITVAELLTQTSGLAEDFTQPRMGKWLGKSTSDWAAIGKVVLKSGKVGVKRYRYNNVNYALLGLVLEAATGQSYSVACADAVNQFPSARLSAKTGGFAPWGGWMMTLADYGRFVLDVVKPSLAETPAASIGGGAYYGPGVLWRQNGSGVNVWHHGLHCFPGRLEAGSFVASWNGPWTVTVAYKGCLSDLARDSLDQVLAASALGN
jgi:CubicO group peptidase (beta-lactamase class C family)